MPRLGLGVGLDLIGHAAQRAAVQQVELAMKLLIGLALHSGAAKRRSPDGAGGLGAQRIVPQRGGLAQVVRLQFGQRLGRNQRQGRGQSTQGVRPGAGRRRLLGRSEPGDLAAVAKPCLLRDFAASSLPHPRDIRCNGVH
jgi:hypothetical protein